MYTAIAVPFIRWGRLGGPAHRAAINRIASRLEEEGYTVTREAYIKTPNGAKSYRFVDVAGEKDGETIYYQVGKQNLNGTPVAREVRAMDDIEGATGIRPEFVPYNTSPPPAALPEDVPMEGDIPFEVDPIP